MIQPLSLGEMGSFLNVLIAGYDHYLYFAFTLMIVFSIGVYIKYLFVGSK